MADTTKNDIINCFHSFPMTKRLIPEGLENQWLMNAIGQYELEIASIGYISEEEKFETDIGHAAIMTLGLLMYTYFLTRELSRIEKLNGFHGKDIQMTGNDTSKRVTYSDLELELKRVDDLLYKQKTHAYN